MNRNVTIVIIILILVVIAGYLVWLRNQYQPPVAPSTNTLPQQTQSPTPTPTIEPSEIASPSASPRKGSPSPTARPRTATPSATEE